MEAAERIARDEHGSAKLAVDFVSIMTLYPRKI